jgi:hypothetical protein
MRQYTKEVFRGRVPIRPNMRIRLSAGREVASASCRKPTLAVDVVAQDRAARLFIAGEDELDRFTKQRVTELPLLLRAVADRFTKIPG